MINVKFHISRYVHSTGVIEIFEPRVPDALKVAKGENLIIPRICAADSIEDCYNAMPNELYQEFYQNLFDGDDFDIASSFEYDMVSEKIGKLYCVYRFSGEYDVIANSELIENVYVPDADRTSECWIMESIAPCEYEFIFITNSLLVDGKWEIEYYSLDKNIDSIVRYDDYIIWGGMNEHYCDDGNLKKIPKVCCK